MEGFGLNVYGSSLAAMLHWEAVSWAIQEYILSETALMIKLIQYLLPNNSDNDILLESNIFNNFDFSMDEDDIEEINSMQLEIETTNDIHVILCVSQKLEMAVEDLKLNLSQHSKTEKTCLQYINYANITWTFIIASRTGDSHLHVITLQKMLHLLSATGHYNHAISARLSIQNMKQLPDSRPWLYEKLVV